MRSFIAVTSSSGATASITSARGTDKMNMTVSETRNSSTFATPMGRNCRKPWMSATSDDARLTS